MLGVAGIWGPHFVVFPMKHVAECGCVNLPASQVGAPNSPPHLPLSLPSSLRPCATSRTHNPSVSPPHTSIHPSLSPSLPAPLPSPSSLVLPPHPISDGAPPPPPARGPPRHPVRHGHGLDGGPSAVPLRKRRQRWQPASDEPQSQGGSHGGGRRAGVVRLTVLLLRAGPVRRGQTGGCSGIDA